jgi:XTP/dITP diphosphohydrolase
MPLYFITGNVGKLRELQTFLPEIVQLDIKIDEIQSLDPIAVIEHKLEQAAQAYDGEFIVEDTSMIFNCIKPLPGTLIKWFEQGMGLDSVVDLVHRYDDHSAVSRSIIGYRDNHGINHFFTGEYGGEIVSRRGDTGFGFDPIFIATGQTNTNAELTTQQKSRFSGRGKAAQLLATHLGAKPSR